MSPSSALAFLFRAVAAAANNGLVGTLPDVYDDTSPLQYLSLRNNKLTGTIPATLGVAGDLQVLQLYARMLARLPSVNAAAFGRAEQLAIARSVEAPGATLRVDS